MLVHSPYKEGLGEVDLLLLDGVCKHLRAVTFDLPTGQLAVVDEEHVLHLPLLFSRGCKLVALLLLLLALSSLLLQRSFGSLAFLLFSVLLKILLGFLSLGHHSVGALHQCLALRHCRLHLFHLLVLG